MSFVICACSSGDSDSSYGSISKVSAEQLIGTWYCTEQILSEDGDTWSKKYDGDDYYIKFSSDFSGRTSGGLLEIDYHRRGNSFRWLLKDGGKILTTDYTFIDDSGHKYGPYNSLYEWSVASINSRSMTLRWEDDGFIIVCKLIKAEQ